MTKEKESFERGVGPETLDILRCNRKSVLILYRPLSIDAKLELDRANAHSEIYESRIVSPTANFAETSPRASQHRRTNATRTL